MYSRKMWRIKKQGERLTRQSLKAFGGGLQASRLVATYIGYLLATHGYLTINDISIVKESGII